MSPRVDTVEVFLDDTPGETRGMTARDGRFEHLFIRRDDDPPQLNWRARSVGRVASVEPAYGAAFIDLGLPPPFGFLKLGGARVKEGDRIEVEVTAEPRGGKGPTLRLIGSASGEPRVLAPGPDVAALLAEAAPGVEFQTGVDAIQASWDAEEEALAASDLFAQTGVDVCVQRTRALIAVDIDHVHLQGRDAKRARDAANREGLTQAARLIRLNGWGGLIAVDFAGTRVDGEAMSALARRVFPDAETVVGPISRFGVLQMSIPWRRSPLDEVLLGPDRRPTLRTRTQDIVRRLRHAMLSDTTVASFTAHAQPEEAAGAVPLVARLGPRAHILPDASVRPGQARIKES